MFSNAKIFNQALDQWDTSSVENMHGMFINTKAFNHSLNSWDLSNVKKTSFMFCDSNFNQDLSLWNTSNVTFMEQMFAYASDFNHPIITWDVSNVTDMDSMFREADSFIDRFNEGKAIHKPLAWINDEDNRIKMKSFSFNESEKKELDSFFDNLSRKIDIQQVTSSLS